MTDKTRLALLGTGSALLMAASQLVLAAPAEPLVVSPLSDPDPNFVPPKPEPRKKGRAHSRAGEASSLDKAMENLGMVIGQAAENQRMREGATSEQIAAEKQEVMKRIQERMSASNPN